MQTWRRRTAKKPKHHIHYYQLNGVLMLTYTDMDFWRIHEVSLGDRYVKRIEYRGHIVFVTFGSIEKYFNVEELTKGCIDDIIELGNIGSCGLALSYD